MREPAQGIGLVDVIVITLAIVLVSVVVIGIVSYAVSRSQTRPFRHVFVDASPLALGVAALIVSIFVSALFGAIVGVVAFLWGQAAHSVSRTTGGRLAARAGQIMGGTGVVIWLVITYIIR